MAIRDLKRLLADMRNLDDVERAVRASEELGRRATAEDVPLLRRLMRRGGYFFRECLGHTLADLEGPSALPFLLDLLNEGIAQNHDHDALASAVTDLADSHAAEVAPALIRWLKGRNSQRRKDAAWLAGYAAAHVPLKLVLAASHDSDAAVRANAIGSLPEYRGQAGVFDRLAGALDDESEQVVRGAILALGYLGDRRALRLLAPFADRPGRDREIAEFALGLLLRPADPK